MARLGATMPYPGVRRARTQDQTAQGTHPQYGAQRTEQCPNRGDEQQDQVAAQGRLRFSQHRRDDRPDNAILFFNRNSVAWQKAEKTNKQRLSHNSGGLK